MLRQTLIQNQFFCALVLGGTPGKPNEQVRQKFWRCGTQRTRPKTKMSLLISIFDTLISLTLKPSLIWAISESQTNVSRLLHTALFVLSGSQVALFQPLWGRGGFRCVSWCFSPFRHDGLNCHPCLRFDGVAFYLLHVFDTPKRLVPSRRVSHSFSPGLLPPSYRLSCLTVKLRVISFAMSHSFVRASRSVSGKPLVPISVPQRLLSSMWVVTSHTVQDYQRR